jgi:hypothetical protein
MSSVFDEDMESSRCKKCRKHYLYHPIMDPEVAAYYCSPECYNEEQEERERRRND